jgi:hypothetical protein
MQQLAMRQQMQWQRRMMQLQETMRIDLTEIRKDTDQDGLTDLVERRLGTDPGRPDTDGDGVPDGADRNPLVPRTRMLTDRQRLIQAVFASLFAGDPNPDPILVVLDKRDWMEFPGVNAPVYCITKDQYGKRIATLNYFRMLQFGGPGPSGTTILNVDGPIAYNDARTRAEVHFWQWQGRNVPANPWMAIYSAQFTTSNSPVDYVALFSRKGAAWKLESLKPWQPDSADAAMGDLMQKQIESGSMQ